MALQGFDLERRSPAVRPSAAEHTLEAHWRLFLLEGSALVVLGVGAVALPLLASLGHAQHWVIFRGQFLSSAMVVNTLVAILFGWMLLASGLMGIVTTLVGQHAPGFFWSLLSSVIATALGAFLYVWPQRSLPYLVQIVTAFLATDGLVTLMLALEYRRAFHARWRLVLLSGLADLAFAALVFFALRRSSIWAVETILGIDFIFGGLSVIGLSLTAQTNAQAALAADTR